MQGKLYGEVYRRTLVCVDACEQRAISGRMYHSSMEYGLQFHSLMELLLDMDELLDEIQLPQATVEMRTFGKRRRSLRGTPVPIVREWTGEIATFEVRVLYRQNASWQGTIKWIEGKKESQFRSVMELLTLVDSALSGGEEKRTEREE